MGEKTLAGYVANCKAASFWHRALDFDGICFGGRSPLPALPLAGRDPVIDKGRETGWRTGGWSALGSQQE